MAEFYKGQIILSEEDKEMFQEANSNMQNHRTPIADSIIKKLTDNLIKIEE